MADQNDLDSSSPIPAQFASMAQCSAALFMPLTVVKHAKKNGCDAFLSGGRVVTRRLMAWLWRRDQEVGDVDWGDRLKRAQALREENKLHKDEGKVIEKDAVVAAISKAMGELTKILGHKFNVEAPPELKGLDEKRIQDFLTNALEEGWTAVRGRFEALARNGETKE